MVDDNNSGPDRPRGGQVRPARPREARLLQRQARQAAYRRYLKLTVLSAVVPGSAFIAAGRRRLGTIVITLSALLLLAVVAVVVFVGPRQLGLDVAVRPGTLRWVGVGLAVLAILWVVLLVASQRVLEPRWLTLAQRLSASGLVILLASVVAAPLALGSQYAFVQRDLVTTIFEDTPLAVNEAESLTRPKQVTEEDPWAGADRVNVLLLGSDASDDREGTRTDSMIVASIDTRTGSTVLFSLPRNLQKVPFPAGPFRAAYPNGFTNGANPEEYLLNAVHDVVPAEHPELFPETIKRPGIEALKLATGEALGLKVDYFVMVDLRGFRDLIDAMGGVVVDVRYRIPIGTREIGPGVCSTPSGYIEPGENQLLDGYRALWFARARCGGGELSDADNSRMRRQRCVIGAIVDRADPANLLRRYQALAGATKKIVSTDIPQGLLPAFVDLADKVQNSDVRSLPFTATTLKGRNYDPDYAEIRQLVRRAIAEPKPSPSAAATAKPSATASPKPSATPKPANASPTPSGDSKAAEGAGTAEALDAVC